MAVIGEKTGSSLLSSALSFFFYFWYGLDSRQSTDAMCCLELTPFVKTADNGVANYWISSNTQATKALNYSYPEYDGLDLATPDVVKDVITAITDRLYGNEKQRHTIFALSTGAVVPEASRYYDWTVRVNVDQYAVGTSFSVLLFLGPVLPDPETWQIGECDTFVGGVSAFVNCSSELCENCKRQRDEGIIIEGFIHLNRSIARMAPELGTLEPDAVKPWLKERLRWRVQKVSRARQGRISPSASCYFSL